MENQSNKVFENAVFDGRVKLTRKNGNCIFCDEKQDCFSFVPERDNKILPICGECLAKLAGKFKRLSGGFIWG